MATTRSSRPRSALTRRRFLGHLGAVGGSSLVMTALSSWDLMAGLAGTRPALSGRPRKAKVLVLGAGVSGLALGYELSRLGYDFHILEIEATLEDPKVLTKSWAVPKQTLQLAPFDQIFQLACSDDDIQFV